MVLTCLLIFYKKSRPFSSQDAIQSRHRVSDSDTLQSPRLTGSVQSAKTQDSPYRPKGKYANFGAVIGPTLKLDVNTEYALELNPTEWEHLQITLNKLIQKAGEIQAEDSYVSFTHKGNQIVYLKPIPSKWKELKDQFHSEIIAAIGEGKANFLFKKSEKRLALITGDFGNLARSLEIFDQRPFVRKQGDDTADWNVAIEADPQVPKIISQYFPPEQQDIFKNSGNSTLLADGNLFFNSDAVPDFLKQIIKIEAPDGK